MSLAFFFPGQGTQRVGMGAEVRRAHPGALARFEAASDCLDFDLVRLCRLGPEATLRRTEYAQPAIFVTGVAHLEWLLDRGLEPVAVAGHSVGELAALVAAGVLTFEEGLRLVVARGRLMAAAPAGSMAAIRGLTEAEAAHLVTEVVSGHEAVAVVAVVNGPEDLVVSGTPAAVTAIGERARDHQATRVRPLSVSGAFHSPLMAPVLGEWADVVAGAALGRPRMPIALNATGTVVAEPEAIRRSMVRHLVDPVRWSASLGALRDLGVVEGVECGEGRSLRTVVEAAGIRMRSARHLMLDDRARSSRRLRRG